MDSEDERSYLRAMLVVTVALGSLAAVVAVLVAIFPGGGDDEPASPASRDSTTSAGPAALPLDVEGRCPAPGRTALRGVQTVVGRS